MKEDQNRDLMIQFDKIRRRLLRSGADLSRIQIVMESGKTGSYITKRIREELGA